MTKQGQRLICLRILVIASSVIAQFQSVHAQDPAAAGDMRAAPVPQLPVMTEDVIAPPPLTNDGGWTWNAGTSVLFVAPRFESNPAFTNTATQVTGPASPPLTTRSIQEFRYDYAATPRIWLGAESQDGVGGRIRWWQFDQNAPTLFAANPPIPAGSPVLFRTVAGQSPLLAIGSTTNLPAVMSIQSQASPHSTDNLTFGTHLSMNVWDFEGTLSDLVLGRWSILLSGGLRYAHLNQNYGSFLAGDLAAGKFPQYLSSGQSFDGLGPTIGVEARRLLESLGLTLTGAARVALLFGSDRHTVTGTNIGLVPTFDPLGNPVLMSNSDSSERLRALPVFELDLGIERVVPVGRLDWVLQGGVISQLWPIGSGPHANGNMALIGFTCGSGLRF